MFCKSPRLDPVKTRLAKSFGEDFAASFYSKLLETLNSEFLHLDDSTQKTCYTLSECAYISKLFKEGFKIQVQRGDRLSEKIEYILKEAFTQSAEKVLIVASDTPDLSSSIIKEAFDRLDSNDIVIGPSEDGGYYLLGLKRFHKQVFSNIDWSTRSVLSQTKERIGELGLSGFYLEELIDIDEASDLLSWLSSSKARHHPLKRWCDENYPRLAE